MFTSSRFKSGLFCFLSLLLLVVSSAADGQLVDENSSNKNAQQNSKINSIKVNKIVTSDSIEQPADTDRVALSKNIPNVNKKYVTQSPVTSEAAAGLFKGSKKSESKKPEMNVSFS